MRKIVKISIFFATIFYPFVVVFWEQYLRYLAMILAILWAFNAVFENKTFFIISAFFIFLSFSSEVKFIYPVLVNLLFLWAFASSLKGEAIITKIAKMREKNLPQIAIIYTRNLTKIWAIFFALNAAICGILPIFSEYFWLIYTGILSYILVGILFVGEILFRKIFVK